MKRTEEVWTATTIDSNVVRLILALFVARRSGRRPDRVLWRNHRRAVRLTQATPRVVIHHRRVASRLRLMLTI
jgi:hypothetical protein